MEFAFILGLISLAFIIAIPILIGVYVYRDAAGRGMNAALWTLIAVLAPALVGFIIYLLVRGSYSDLQCPSCANTIIEQYVVCPKCGAKLKASCSNCGLPVESDWTVCPKCAAQLPQQTNDFVPPVKNKDKALGKILIAVILIPVLLLVLLGIFSFSSFGSGSSMNTVLLSIEDYKENYKEPMEIIAWINECDNDPSKVYALCYQTERGEQKETHYLIYRPSAIKTDSVDTNNISGMFGMSVEVKFYETTGLSVDDNKLTCISNYSNKFTGLKVFVNGKRVDCEITEVDFNPALFEMVSEPNNPAIIPAN